MRIHTIACAAISIIALAGCSAEIAQRPAAEDPTSVAAAEAPFRRPPLHETDPPPSALKPTTTTTDYTCPMHPEVHLDKPGRCAKCGMRLVRAKDGGP